MSNDFVRIQAEPCLNCGRPLSGIGVPKGGTPPPSDGDLAVCMYCSHIHVFDGGKMRNPTDAEMVEIAGDPDLLKVIKFNELYNAMFGGRDADIRAGRKDTRS
jgi:hypothetical protein